MPPTTHRYLIEAISATPHAKTMLCSRLVGFKNQLMHSRKLVVRLMAMLSVEDRRTVMGKNLKKISNDIEEQGDLSCNLIKKCYRYFKVPEEEVWRLGCLNDLFYANGSRNLVENFTENDVKQLVSALCTA